MCLLLQNGLLFGLPIVLDTNSEDIFPGEWQGDSVRRYHRVSQGASSVQLSGRLVLWKASLCLHFLFPLYIATD
jgi:hypothetical protein